MPARQTLFDTFLATVAAPAGDIAPTIDVLRGSAAKSLLLDSGRSARRGRRPGNAFQQDGLLRAVLLAAGDRVAIVVVKRGDEIRTIWPLRFERRYGLTLAVDLTAPFAQYSDVIGEPLDGHALWMIRTKLRDAFGADAILCRGVRQDSGLAEALAETGGAPIDETSAPYVDLKAFGSFENYQRRFSKQTTRTRRQRRNKLEAAHGPLGFAVLDGESGRPAVETALQWKRGWLQANGLSSRVIGAPDQEGILLAAIESEATRISVLSANGKPVSVELGFTCANSYSSYLGAFDPAFAIYSPGQEQMLLTIEWCFAQGFARYDLLPPGDAYKLHWTRDGDAEPAADHCVALSSAGALYALALRHARAPIKRTVLSLPTRLRVAARRYGPAVAGIGATAATIGILAD